MAEKMCPADFPLDDVGNDRDMRQIARQIAEILARVHRVAVKRNTRAKAGRKRQRPIELLDLSFGVVHRRLLGLETTLRRPCYRCVTQCRRFGFGRDDYDTEGGCDSAFPAIPVSPEIAMVREKSLAKLA